MISQPHHMLTAGLIHYLIETLGDIDKIISDDVEIRTDVHHHVHVELLRWNQRKTLVGVIS